jgi:hypothetical protein
MLLNSAGEEKSEGHSVALKCPSNNVYEFSDSLPIIALIESIDDDHHR